MRPRAGSVICRRLTILPFRAREKPRRPGTPQDREGAAAFSAFTVARDRGSIRLLVTNDVLDDEGDVPYLDQDLVDLLQDTAGPGD